ncbi:MAG: DUF4399 domain-containing protein [Bdellovibrio sp.]
MYSKIFSGLFLSASVCFSTAQAFGAAAAGKVFFVEPKDGATVTSPVHVVFGLTGMKIKVAGDAADKTTGHHHLIVDGGPIPAGQVIPADATHVHYGKGQTEDNVKLSPGKHKLTLQFADGAHRSYGEPLSATVNIIVK